MRFPARLAALCLLIGTGLPPVLARAATPAAPAKVAVPLAAHRALYELTLDSSRGGRQIASARGTMGYEVVDVCDGWATRQRLRMTITSGEGQDTDMDSDYATWEAKDGLNFRFHMIQKSDQSVTSQTDGSARLTRAGGPGEVLYRLPKEAKTELPAGTLFPMMHTLAIIDWKLPFATDHPILTPLASARVRIAFFDHGSGSPTPTYEAAMRYWENGVADGMVMDFGDFVMKAKLKELTPIPRRC